MPGEISPPGRVRHPVPGKAAKRTMVVGQKGKRTWGSSTAVRRFRYELARLVPASVPAAGGPGAGRSPRDCRFYSPSKSLSSDSASASSSNGSSVSSSLSVVTAALTTSCSTSERL